MRLTRPIKVQCRQKVLTLRKFLKQCGDKTTGKRKTPSKVTSTTSRLGKRPTDARVTKAKKHRRPVNRNASRSALCKPITIERIRSTAIEKDSRGNAFIDAPSVEPLLDDGNYRNSSQIRPCAEGSGQIVDTQLLNGRVVIDQTLKVAEVNNTSKGDQYKEIIEKDLLFSKKRGTLEEEWSTCGTHHLRFPRSGRLSLVPSVKMHRLRWLLAVQLTTQTLRWLLAAQLTTQMYMMEDQVGLLAVQLIL